MSDSDSPTGDASTRFHLRRSIVVGLGGTGRHVCTQLKKLLRAAAGGDEQGYPHVRILSIDTDARRRGQEAEDGSIVELGNDERLALRIPAGIDDERFNEFMNDSVKRLLPYANEQGAMRCRPLGYAFLATCWREVRRHVRGLCIGLQQAKLADLVRIDPRFAGLELDRSRIDVYVVANLVSGTGSGTALAMGYLLRDLVREVRQDGTTFVTEGIFTTCSLSQIDDADYPVNCYASLLELAHFSDPEVHRDRRLQFRPGFDGFTLRPEAVSQAPYDLVQLLNPSHTGGGGMSVEEFEPFIAQVLALRTGSHVGMKASAKVIDERAGRNELDRRGNRRFCVAWGAESFRSAGQHLIDLAVLRAAQRFLDRLYGDAGDEARAIQRAETIVETLGLRLDAEGDATLLDDLLTPAEQMEGVATGVSLHSAIQTTVQSRFPHPQDDPDTVRDLPSKIQRRKGELLDHLRSLIRTVSAENRRTRSEQIREMLQRELAAAADPNAHPAGSVTAARRLAGLLVGDGDGAPALLSQDGDAYRAAATETSAQVDRWSAAAEQAERQVKEIVGMRRGFTYQALSAAWTQFTEALVRQLQAEARRRALDEAYRILAGDEQDRNEVLRLGLIKHLEAWSLRLRGTGERLERGRQRFDRRATAVLRRLGEDRRGQAEVDDLEREATELVGRAFASGGERAVAQEWVEQFGPLHLFGERPGDAGTADEEERFVDRMLRRRVEEIGQDRVIRSLEDDPDLGGRLSSYLERAQPAIRLNPNVEVEENLAFASIPSGADEFRKALGRHEWIQERLRGKDVDELIEERPGDGEPRVDVLSATLTFSPAAIFGIDEWAASYQHKAATAVVRRRIHVIADRERGEGLIFEPLGTTEERVQLAYLMAISSDWLRDGEAGRAVYSYPGEEGGLFDRTHRREFNFAVADPGMIGELQQALREGSANPTYSQPVFLHVLDRFKGSLTVADPWHPTEGVLSHLADGLRRLVQGAEAWPGARVLPGRDDDAFAALEYSLRCILGRGPHFERLRAAVKETTRGSAGVEAEPVAARQCEKGHPMEPGDRFCRQCGAGEMAAAKPLGRCEHCGSDLAAGSQFCSQCGEAA